MKNLFLMAVVSYAVLLGGPRNLQDLSVLALQAALVFAEISVMLKPSDSYDAGFAEPHFPLQDA
jgi:hypothetical protein